MLHDVCMREIAFKTCKALNTNMATFHWGIWLRVGGSLVRDLMRLPTFFLIYLILLAALGPRVYSASNRIHCQESSMELRAAGWRSRLTNSPPSLSILSRQCWILNNSQPYKPLRHVTRNALFFLTIYISIWRLQRKYLTSKKEMVTFNDVSFEHVEFWSCINRKHGDDKRQLHLPTTTTWPNTLPLPMAEQFQRRCRNCSWHSTVPRRTPSPIATMASGDERHMSRCSVVSPGMRPQMTWASSAATTLDSTLGQSTHYVIAVLSVHAPPHQAVLKPPVTFKRKANMYTHLSITYFKKSSIALTM
jgi:hypothetical protein